jgi:PadR family transcriptional regulator PadR
LALTSQNNYYFAFRGTRRYYVRVAGIDPQMLKGLVALLLLILLDEREDYGYSLVERLHDGGLDDVAEGTVYPALARLEQSGWVSTHLVPSDKGPARKYYRITDPGQQELTLRLKAWDHLVHTIGTFTEGNPR